jgi:hypothetical protein
VPSPGEHQLKSYHNDILAIFTGLISSGFCLLLHEYFILQQGFYSSNLVFCVVVVGNGTGIRHAVQSVSGAGVSCMLILSNVDSQRPFHLVYPPPCEYQGNRRCRINYRLGPSSLESAPGSML